MIIRRINDHTIRCIISQEDLRENEIDLDDLLEHKPRAMEYLRSIVMEAAKDEDFHMEGAFTSMQVRVLGDNSICLTLSQGVKPQILRELKDAAEKIRESIQDSDPGAVEACARALSESAGQVVEDVAMEGGQEETHSKEREETAPFKKDVIYTLMFDSVAEAAQICRSVPEASLLISDLYRDQQQHVYYLFFNACGSDAADETTFEKILLKLDEFGTFLELSSQSAAYIREHYQCILKENAAAQLARL